MESSEVGERSALSFPVSLCSFLPTVIHVYAILGSSSMSYRTIVLYHAV
jgi:hypothetical protein